MTIFVSKVDRFRNNETIETELFTVLVFNVFEQRKYSCLNVCPNHCKNKRKTPQYCTLTA